MLHQIPNKINVVYKKAQINDNDRIVLFKEDSVLLIDGSIPQKKYFKEIDDLTFAFNIDGDDYFVGNYSFPEEKYIKIKEITSSPLSFILVCAYHLANWLVLNKYCGFCGNKLKHSNYEQALVCPECKNVIYPKISPAIIVAITCGEYLLLTKYADNIRNNYALVAGYCELGETLEDTLRREVLEEVNLKVKNIRYYSNQPWGYSGSLLMGFVAELDGSMDELKDNILEISNGELKEARWFKRDEIPSRESLASLTATMIEDFKNGVIK